MTEPGPSTTREDAEPTGPVLRSAMCPSNNSSTKSSRSLPRVAGLASTRGSGSTSRNKSDHGRRPASTTNVELSLSETDWQRVRQMITAEAAPIFTRIVTEEMQEQMPSIKLDTPAEVIRTADSIEQRLTTLIDTRLGEMRSHPSREHPEVKHLIMEEIQKERAYYALKLDEIERKMTSSYADVQQGVKDFEETTQILDIAHRVERLENTPQSQGHKSASPSDGEASEKGKESRRSRRSKRNSRRNSRRRSKSRDRKSHSSTSSSSEDTSSNSEDSPRRKNLAELNPSNTRFKRVLSYKTYLISNNDQRENSKVCKRVASYSKRMGVSINSKFNLSDPIAVLKFLAQFKEAADRNGISEGAARLLLPDFLQGKAKTGYNASLHADAIRNDSGGIRTFVDVVQ